MATREQVFLTVIAKLSNLGRPLYDPASGDYAAYENEYLEALGNFEWDTLTRAMEMVRGEWSALTWPPPGRIAQAAVAAEREDRDSRPDRPAVPYFKPPDDVTRAERLSVGEKMGRMKKLMASGEFASMSHEQSYDAVYGTELKPGHKAGMMDRLYGRGCAA